MKRASFVIVLLPLLTAAAQPLPLVRQAGRQFSVDRLDVKQGDTVRFVNDDVVRHNIAVQTPSGDDEAGSVQEPGAETVLSFAEAGRYRVHCLIHPRMKMTVIAE